MKAQKRFPVFKECKRCKGKGRLSATRPVSPCIECKHDVHFEHTARREYVGSKRYRLVLECKIDNCGCKLAIATVFEEEQWPHP